MNHEARTLFNTILTTLTRSQHRESFRTLTAGFLDATGNPRPEHAITKSPAALSRFLNEYDWDALNLIRIVRRAVLERLWETYALRRGRRPVLELILDLTTLEKTGAFPELEIHFLLVRQHLTGYSRQLNDKIGLHLVVLYVMVGPQRFPWAFLIWKGKDTPSPAKLALKLLARIPAWWPERFSVRVLADSGFDSNEFIDGVHDLGLHGVIGSRANRSIGDGRCLSDLRCKGALVQFKSCRTPVYASWFKREQPVRCCLVSKKLQRARKEFVWRYVISTRTADGETIKRWGRRRWRIEAFFKTLKSRFGFDQFGQRSARGVFRFLVLALMAFVLAFWMALETDEALLDLDWGVAARAARDDLVPEVVAGRAWLALRRVKPILEARGVTCWTVFV